MAMGTRKQRENQEGLWIAHTELATAPGHPFYQKLDELLEAEGFDEFVEQRCAKFYGAKYGRLSLTPGIHFRLGVFRVRGPQAVPPARAFSVRLRPMTGTRSSCDTVCRADSSGGASRICSVYQIHPRHTCSPGCGGQKL